MSSGITKETRKAKELLEEYNATCMQISERYCPTVISDVLQTDSNFWQSVSNSEDNLTKDIPWDTQRDIIQAFLLMKRSEEELKLLTDDMQNVLTYWSNRIVSLTATVEELNNHTDQFSIGAKSSLKQLLWEATLQHSRASDIFEHMVKEETSSYDDSDLDSETSDSDSEDDLF